MPVHCFVVRPSSFFVESLTSESEVNAEESPELDLALADDVE